jgi:hypothetical protein
MADDQLYTLVQKMKDIEAMDPAPEAEAPQAEAPVPAPEAPEVPTQQVANQIKDIQATGEGLYSEYETFAQTTTPDDIGQLAGTGSEGSSSSE